MVELEFGEYLPGHHSFLAIYEERKFGYCIFAHNYENKFPQNQQIKVQK